MNTQCPKCHQERRADAVACFHCGLVVERWSHFRAEVPAHPVLDHMWPEVLRNWTNPEAHTAFIDTAAAHEALAIAAARYAQSCQEIDKVCEARIGLQRTAVLAEQILAMTVSAHRERAGSARRLVRYGVFAALLAVAGALTIGVGFRRAQAAAVASVR